MNKKKLPDYIIGFIPRVKVIGDFSKLEKSFTRKITFRHGNLIERERLLINQEKMMVDSIKIYLDSKPVVSK